MFRTMAAAIVRGKAATVASRAWEREWEWVARVTAKAWAAKMVLRARVAQVANLVPRAAARVFRSKPERVNDRA